MKILRITGDYSAVGMEIGTQLSAEIKHVLNGFKSSKVFEKLETFLQSTEGCQIYDRFYSTTERFCPHYVTELRGMAAGAGVLYRDLFLLNLNPEWIALLASCPGGSHGVKYLMSEASGCTNVYVNNAKAKLFVHTEDQGDGESNQGAIIDVTITVNGDTLESYVVFIQPGVLEGSTFGVNGHGLVHAHNNVFQNGLNTEGIPKRFVQREHLSMSSPHEIQTSLTLKPGISTSSHCQYVWCDSAENRMCSTSIEVSGDINGPNIYVFKPQNFFFHCNTFQHLKTSCHPEESSIHRAALLAQYSYMPPPETKDAILDLISNQQDTSVPVYRTAIHPDHLCTSASVLFDMERMMFEVYTEVPNTSQAIASFPIPSYVNKMENK